ncbi:hypothetical protein Ciccas_007357 [Cichlidogyrus casuarinus]|uniref:DNA mitochondrial polymerase exonuclease domain-containing protein n=1 Tax=Cichlidogyrus casuarinus TaxID=1844966 RepID=A0ABD2Q5Q4_9PLAT
MSMSLLKNYKYRQFNTHTTSFIKILRRFSSSAYFNEVNIQMIDRDLRNILFGAKNDKRQTIPKDVLRNLVSHGVDIRNKRPLLPQESFRLPSFVGEDVSEHVYQISHEISKPYIKLINSFLFDPPPLPKTWSQVPGWTKQVYNSDGSCKQVVVPDGDVFVFDTEILVQEGPAPKLAVALSPTNWYSWTSPTLNTGTPQNQDLSLDEFVRFSSGCEKVPKCIIGHFVSFDRARIADEYSIKDSGIRFLDTLSLHMCVSGLTSLQRNLKVSANKKNFNNKVWKQFTNHTSTKSDADEDSEVSLEWLPKTSLNSLKDVYKLYCEKDPPVDKSTRNVFVKGTKEEVLEDFQNLMTYCASDVLMTYSVFQKLLPIFRQRFPHPTTLCGMLEMGSLYLPVSDAWLKFIHKSQSAFHEITNKNRRMLMKLADDAVAKFGGHSQAYKNDPWLWDLDWETNKRLANKPAEKLSEAENKLSKLPNWYTKLIEKPVLDHVDDGPVLITLYQSIAPKLLRLCWQGIPLHLDSVRLSHL